MTKILFICAANSCRSQVAEGFARHYGMGRIEAQSAGIRPCLLDRRAVQVMVERGIDIAGHRSKGLGQVAMADMGVIVTLCQWAMNRLPPLSEQVHHIHWEIADPTRIRGTEERALKAYRKLCDDLEAKIKRLLVHLDRLKKRPAAMLTDERWNAGFVSGQRERQSP